MTPPLGPLSFTPLLKRTIWGGRRLGEKLGKPIGVGEDYAESWELVDRASDQSVVENDPLAGRTLGELISTRSAELLGRHAHLATFPLLLKYLDCQRVLSVQVHPDDAFASTLPNPDLGKTEAWYIVESAPQSLVYAGLKSGVDREELAQAIARGRTADVLHSFHPAAGQCLFIPAGTVHALGDGLLVAEIQQSSDTTFRLFDWDRLDAHGQPRALHVEQALAATDYGIGPISPQTPERGDEGWETIVACDKFLLRRAISSHPSQHRWQTAGDDAPVVLMVVSGRATIFGSGWEPRQYSVGQTVLLPACLGETTIELSGADAAVLEVTLP
ncbi:MAG: type I phosphomannose isomerase catalytic subunit [Planctomycetaceae bacterium]